MDLSKLIAQIQRIADSPRGSGAEKLMGEAVTTSPSSEMADIIRIMCSPGGN